MRRHAAAALVAVGCAVALAPAASALPSGFPDSVSAGATSSRSVGTGGAAVTDALPIAPQPVPPASVPALPPVTVPPVTVPPVTVPPVTVPRLPTGALPPPAGRAVDGATGTVDRAVGEVTGALPGAGGTGSAPAPPDDGASAGSGTDPGSGDGGAGNSGPTPAGSGRVQGGPTGTAGVDSGASGGSVGRSSASSDAVTAADVAGPAGAGGPIGDAVRQDARRFGWPLVLGLAVVAFLALQGRVERHERKLADAPLDQGERLRFR